jgi:hypothetical protein
MRLKHIQDDHDQSMLSIDKRIERIFDSLLSTYDYHPRMLIFTLNLQGSDIFACESNEMAQRIKGSIADVIEDISGLLIKGMCDPQNRKQAKKLARLIWLQFTGVVLLNNVSYASTHIQMTNMQKVFHCLSNLPIFSEI